MHLRSVALLVASSVAVTTIAESVKDASMTHPPLAQPPSMFNPNDPPTDSVDDQRPFDATNEEKVLQITKKLDAFPFYKAVHDDVAFSLYNIKGAVVRKIWQFVRRDPEDQYYKLKLDRVPDDLLLENLNWKKWVVFVCQKYSEDDPAKVVVRLMRHLKNDRAFLKILVKGVKQLRTKTIAKFLLEAKQQLWLEIKLEPQEVFVGFGLDQNAQSLVDNELFSTWVEYVQAYQTKYPDSKVTVEGCLEKVFKTKTNVLTVLTSANNRNSETGQVVLKQLFEEETNSATFFQALMHSWSGLRAYFTKNRLQDDAQHEEFMILSSPENKVDCESLRNLREFMMANAIRYPKPEDILRVLLDEDDPIVEVWIDYMKLYTVKMPVTYPVIKTFEMLTSSDNAAKNSQSILRLFVNDWVQKSVEPNKVYKMLLSDKGQEAKESQEVWKTFIDEYQKQQEVRLPGENEITSDRMDEVVTPEKDELWIPVEIKSLKGQDAEDMQDAWRTFIDDYRKMKMAQLPEKSETTPNNMDDFAYRKVNELELPAKIKTFKELSAKLSSREPDDDITMRMIVWDLMRNQPQPEQVLTTLLLDAGATRLLDDWVGYIGEYLGKMVIANQIKTTSQLHNDPTYINMLRMLNTVRDLGHLPSRKIMSQHELKWLDNDMSPTQVFKILELDKAINEKLEEVITLKKEAAEKLAETASTSKTPLAGSLRPTSARLEPSVKDGSSVLNEEIAALYDKEISELLNNPLLAVYLDFEKHYNGRHKTNETLLKTLLATFEEGTVAKLLNAVKKRSPPVQDLQIELIKHFVEKGYDSSDVLRLLELTNNNDQSAWLYVAFGQAYIEIQKSKTSYRWNN